MPFETETVTAGDGGGAAVTIYCKIENGIVVDRIIFDAEGMPEDWPDAELFIQSGDAQIGWTYVREEFIAPERESPPELPSTYRLYKSVFIRRLTSEEAETMEGVLAQADAKLRLMFNSVEFFVSDDPLFETLMAAVGAGLGSIRAEELLAPETA